MALLNFMFFGSYTIVENVRYSKQDRNISMDIKVFRGPDKTDLIHTVGLFLNGREKIKVFEGVTSAVPVPEFGKIWLVGPNPPMGSDWMCRDGFLAWWEIPACGPVMWCFKEVAPKDIYMLPNGDYVHLLSDGSHSPKLQHVFESRHFDQFFSIDQMSGDGKNILEACYTYLKTRPEFADCASDN